MSEELELSDGTKVTLMTAWMPMSWELQWDDGIAAGVSPAERARIEPHRGHYVSYLDSAFGWRAIHCTDCDQRLWDVHEVPSGLSRESNPGSSVQPEEQA